MAYFMGIIKIFRLTQSALYIQTHTHTHKHHSYNGHILKAMISSLKTFKNAYTNF